jgi:hypothetical protein
VEAWKVKVLYLWNTAGVFTPIAEYLIDNGGDAKILSRYEFDIYHHTQDSRAAYMVNTPLDYYLAGMKLVLKYRPDIIHINGSLKMLPLARILAWRTPIVFTYHGSDVRNPTGKPHKEVVELSDHITVTTSDLEQYGHYIERPLDSRFYYRGGRRSDTALMFYKRHFYVDRREAARQWAEKRDIELTILDENNPIFPLPFHEMPKLLSQFEYYLDWKGQKEELYALSKTALEALACGCKVVHDSAVNKAIKPEEWHDCGVRPYLELYASLHKASWRRALRRLVPVIKALMNWRKLKRYGEIWAENDTKQYYPVQEKEREREE